MENVLLISEIVYLQVTIQLGKMYKFHFFKLCEQTEK